MTGRVLVVGSLHLDVLVRAPRLPVLGETLPGSAFALKAGGKGGNQACEAARHGATTAMVARVGEDEFGRRLRSHLTLAGVDTTHVTAGETGSGMSVAVLEPGGDYAAVIVSGANLDLGAADIDAAFARHAPRVLVLQNEIPAAANLHAAERARRHGAVVLLNAAPARARDDALAALVDVLVVNAIEAAMLGAGTVGSLDDASRAAEALASERCSAIVTAGAQGVALHESSGKSLCLPAHEVAVASTHGAGDAFIGALAARLAAGDALDLAVRYAHAAAAVLVATPEPQRGRLSASQTRRMLGPD